MGLKKQFVSAILLGSALTAPLFAQDIATPSSSIDTLAIFSFNDFHGAFASDGITPGAARLVQMTQNEKQRYPHSIVVSGGDIVSPTPHLLNVDAANRLDLQKGVKVIDKKGKFADDVKFLTLTPRAFA